MMPVQRRLLTGNEDRPNAGIVNDRRAYAAGVCVNSCRARLCGFQKRTSLDPDAALD